MATSVSEYVGDEAKAYGTKNNNQRLDNLCKRDDESDVIKADIGNLTDPDTKNIVKKIEDMNKSLSLEMQSGLMSPLFLTRSTSNIPTNHYALCGLWDFAGQQEFYATHQAFLTSSAIYLVVADLAEDICKQRFMQCFADFRHVGGTHFLFTIIDAHIGMYKLMARPSKKSKCREPISLNFLHFSKSIETIQSVFFSF